ncbi:MAG: hypothetical protein QMC67_06810 [Candidatus Wallbacteria bacterium]
MLNNKYKEILKESVIDAIESLAFVQLIENTESLVLKLINETNRQTMLSVYQSVNNQYYLFILTISPKLLKDIIINIFGLDPDTPITPEMEKDTISELLNTIAGKFMRNITPETDIFQLGLPIPEKYPIDITSNNSINCIFESEDGENIILSFLEFAKK